ncbi:MAG: DUF1338 family protein [bacterium]|nr:DUF1338 family protein [bacterium]
MRHELSTQELEVILRTFRHDMAPQTPQEEVLADVLEHSLGFYFDRVPDAAKVFRLCQENGDPVLNDHVAFRSIGVGPIEGNSIVRLFENLGYTVEYDSDTGKPFNFKGKKLDAVYLRHPRNPNMPRIFVSQLRIDGDDAIVPEAAEIVRKSLTDATDPLAGLSKQAIDGMLPSDIAHKLHEQWIPPVNLQDYLALLEDHDSEYAAWVLHNKFWLNHFTLTVNGLNNTLNFTDKLKAAFDSSNSFEDVLPFYETFMRNEFIPYLTQNGFVLNAPDGKVLNVSPDGLLLQCSTKAGKEHETFPCGGQHDVATSYVEFAIRGLTRDAYLALKEENMTWAELDRTHYREGFETANATTIFESTNIHDRPSEAPSLWQRLTDFLGIQV